METRPNCLLWVAMAVDGHKCVSIVGNSYRYNILRIGPFLKITAIAGYLVACIIYCGRQRLSGQTGVPGGLVGYTRAY